jgi:hypothetical protein
VQQDWLLRMIAQLSTFVMGIKRLREQKQWTEVHEQIEGGIERFAGLNASLVHAISEDDLIQLLSTRGGVDLDRWWALAALLREEGLALEEQGDGAGAERAFAKSLRMYLEVLSEAEDVPGYLNVTDLEDVITRMIDRDLTRTTRLGLVEFLRATGRLESAENVVQWALDGSDPDAASDAADFYQVLSRMTDAELEAGGLSRAEIADALLTLTAE